MIPAPPRTCGSWPCPERSISSDALIRLTKDDAPHTIHLDARDTEGNVLVLPETPAGLPATTRHHTVLHLQRTGRPIQSIYIGRKEWFHTSDLSNYRIDVQEMFLDTAGLRFFNVQHEPLRDVRTSARLTKQSGDYVQARFDWAKRPESTLSACCHVNVRTGTETVPYLWTATVETSMVDLGIEIEDLAGNRLTWTQSPAFAAGDVPPGEKAPGRAMTRSMTATSIELTTSAKCLTKSVKCVKWHRNVWDGQRNVWLGQRNVWRRQRNL